MNSIELNTAAKNCEDKDVASDKSVNLCLVDDDTVRDTVKEQDSQSTHTNVSAFIQNNSYFVKNIHSRTTVTDIIFLSDIIFFDHEIFKEYFSNCSSNTEYIKSLESYNSGDIQGFYHFAGELCVNTLI